jgi:hypothetical protein
MKRSKFSEQKISAHKSLFDVDLKAVQGCVTAPDRCSLDPARSHTLHADRAVPAGTKLNSRARNPPISSMVAWAGMRSAISSMTSMNSGAHERSPIGYSQLVVRADPWTTIDICGVGFFNASPRSGVTC